MKSLIQKSKNSFTYLNISDVNKNVIATQYAVRGAVPAKSQEIAEELQLIKAGKLDKSYPFDEIIQCNIGNPQIFDQPPISFNRQVLAGVLDGSLVKQGVFKNKDVVNRIEFYREHIAGNVGAYSASPGFKFGQQSVSDFIKRRDGAKQGPDTKHITLLGGASEGVNLVLSALISHGKDGVMIPIPQYPLYSALIQYYGGSQVNYYLNEQDNWSTSIDSLKNAQISAGDVGVKPKILVVINPGNPTGAVLTRENIEDMIKFAYDNKIIIIADEVYQENVYTDKSKFYSFRKIVTEMPEPYNKTELVSLHSTSKGIIGECGLRGGYMELHNLNPEVEAQIDKIKTVGLCSNTIGQLTTDLMCNHPRVNAEYSDETVEQYNNEVKELFGGLKERAQLINKYLNKMDNVQAQEQQGAMYAFPRIALSKKAQEAAQKQGMAPDLFYCMEVLLNTGIVLVPGSGFGQEPGTFHFRTTNLVRPAEKLQQSMQLFTKFNNEFHKKYA